MEALAPIDIELTFACDAGGMGGVALGGENARGEFMLGDQLIRYHYTLTGSIDVNADRNRELERLLGRTGIAHAADMFTRQQYIGFHSTTAPVTDTALALLLSELVKKCKHPDRRVDMGDKIFWRYKSIWYEVLKWAEPPEGWEEMTPEDMRRYQGVGPLRKAPDCKFASMPCQGNSRLNPEDRAGTLPYIILNELVPRSFYLTMLAWTDEPVKLMFSENVPGIKDRSKDLLADMDKAAKKLGLAVQHGNHDTGKVCGAPQSRPRHFWVHRHKTACPPYLYKPANRPLVPIMDYLADKPMPGDPAGGAMHDLPKLEFLTWLRLALIKPGGDWKDIPGPGEWQLCTLDGRIVPPEAFSKPAFDKAGKPKLDKHDEQKMAWFWPDVAVWGKVFVAELLPGAKNYADVRLKHNPMGNVKSAYHVQDPDKASLTITADPRPSKSGGASTVADNRLHADIRCPDKADRHGSHMRVTPADGPAGAVTGATHLANGAPSVSDLRLSTRTNRHGTIYQVWDDGLPSDCVTTSDRLGSGAPSLADPRLTYEAQDGAYGVTALDSECRTVTGNTSVTSSNGPGAVADPRIIRNAKGGTMRVLDGEDAANTVTTHTDVNGDAQSLADARMTCSSRNGTLGVVKWTGPSPAIIASLDVYCGQAAIEDVRVNIHYWPKWFPQGFIISPWNAWHRPLTDWELWILQTFPAYDVGGKPWVIKGTRKDRRQAIGNAVMPRAAKVYFETMAPTLIVARLAKDAYLLNHTGAGVWVDRIRQSVTPEVWSWLKNRWERVPDSWITPDMLEDGPGDVPLLAGD